MGYRRHGDSIYVRTDRGDEIIGCVRDVCRKEKIMSAAYSGIVGCGEAQIQTFIFCGRTRI